MGRISSIAVLIVAGLAIATGLLMQPGHRSVAAAGEGDKVAAAPEVTVAGLRIARVDKKNKYGQSMASGILPGTAVAVRIATPGRHIISIDHETSTLVKFADDKGTVLGTPGKQTSGKRWLRHFANISDDHRSCTPWIESKKLPAAGATRLEIEATVALVCGTDEKSGTASAALTKGTKLKLGPIDAEIAEVKDSRRGDMKVQVKFSSSQSFDAIRKIEFLGPDGAKIKHGTGGSSRWSMGGKATYTRTYRLAKKVETLTVKVTYFGKLETLKVPLKLSVGVGL